MPFPGQQSPKSGEFRSYCCGLRVTVTKGDRFPDCGCHRKIGWMFIREIDEDPDRGDTSKRAPRKRFWF